MKRLSKRRKKWHLVRAANELKKAEKKRKEKDEKRLRKANAALSLQSSAVLLKVPRPNRTFPLPIIIQERGQRRQKTYLICPPEVFSFRLNHDAVAHFFSQLRHEIYNVPARNRKFGGIDFRKIREITPGAALVLAAELQQCQEEINRRLRTIKYAEWHPSVVKHFAEMGLFELLQTPDFSDDEIEDRVEGVKFIRYQSQIEVDGSACKRALDLLAELAGPIEARTFVYDGLVEAIKNVRHHAYPRGQDLCYYPLPDQWWMCGGCFVGERSELATTVYDAGVGIPATLPRSTIWEAVRGRLSDWGRNDDASMIAAAMEVGRSSTGLSQRGKGLPVMMRLFDQRVGHLRVLSGRGEVIYRGGARPLERITHELPINGTLIQWRMQDDGIDG